MTVESLIMKRVPDAMAIQGYYLGCPMWGFKGWVGNLYRRHSPAREFLGQYAGVFNVVEGNTTFYGLPSEETVERWLQAVPASFRFCFKLPQAVTHHKGLEDAAAETAEFLARMAPLEEHLGPFMIQLPPSFGPDRLDVLERYLRSLPGELLFAVELRHPGFYRPEISRRLDELLAEHDCERIMMDTRPLRSGDSRHPDVRAATHRKPDLPVEPVALGRHPFLRLICYPKEAVNEPWVEDWSRHLARWIRQGKRPYVIVHCPNNVQAPPLARRLHRLVTEHAEVGEMPPWPGEREQETGQMSLL